MVTYPVSVPHSAYRGRNPAKLRRAREFDSVAETIEAHLSAELENVRPGRTSSLTAPSRSIRNWTEGWWQRCSTALTPAAMG